MFSAILRYWNFLVKEETYPQLLFLLFGLINLVSPYNCETDILDKLNYYSMFLIVITGVLVVWSKLPRYIILNLYLTVVVCIFCVISTIMQAVNLPERIDCMMYQFEQDTINRTYRFSIGTKSLTPAGIENDMISRGVMFSLGVVCATAFTIRLHLEYRNRTIDNCESQQTVVASSNSTDVTLRATSQSLQQ